MTTLQQALKTAFPYLREPCQKVAHPSRGKAEAHLRALLKREEDCIDPTRLNVYQCPSCNMWHTGHAKR